GRDQHGDRHRPDRRPDHPRPDARLLRPTGSPFTVWTREHADAGLEVELGALGFHPIHREPGMAFLPGAGRPAPPLPGATIRPVTDDAGRRDYARIMTRAFALHGAPAAS